MSRYDGRYDISLYIIHANLRFVREKPNAKRYEVDVCIRFIFPIQNESWYVLYLCRSCVETSPHSTHPCLTRPQICIPQPGYTAACVSTDLDPSRFWIPYDVTHCLGMRSSLKCRKVTYKMCVAHPRKWIRFLE